MATTAIPVSHDYEEKLARLLTVATDVFAQKGYHHASIRDIARSAGVSLSGLYYYFSSKEELLYMIQARAFRNVIARLERELDGVDDPEEKLHTLVRNHVRFFAQNMESMKVLSHEYDALEGPYRDEIRDLRLRYSNICTEILRELRRNSGGGEVAPLNVATYALFGMMNWIYTWYRPGRSVSVDRLADHLYEMFLEGFMSGGPRAPAKRVRSRAKA